MVQREHDHAAGDAHRYHFRRKHPGLFLDGVDAGNRLSDVARGTQFRHATQIGSALTVIEPSPETTSPAELAGSQEPGGDSFAALAGSSRREPRAAALSSTAREIRPSRSRSSTPSVVSAAVRAHRSSRIGAAVGMSHPAMSAPPATAASSSTVTTHCIETRTYRRGGCAAIPLREDGTRAGDEGEAAAATLPSQSRTPSGPGAGGRSPPARSRGPCAAPTADTYGGHGRRVIVTATVPRRMPR